MNNVGIIIIYSDPLWKTPRVSYNATPESITSYNHSITAEDGFKSANFVLTIPEKDVYQWMEYGLGRDIEVFNGNGGVIWKGFVNKISSQVGARSYGVGPLMDAANRIIMTYTPILDIINNQLVTGATVETPAVNDTLIQDSYGIIERILSGGTLYDAEAVSAVAAYLAESKYPLKDESLSFSTAGVANTITVDCLGYKEWFKVYIYNCYTNTTSYYSAKIKTIAALDPNNIFSTDYGHISDNLSITADYEDNNQQAYTILQSIVARGDINYYRWTLQVLEDNLLYYDVTPSEVEYFYHIKGGEKVLYMKGIYAIPPWNVRPAKWLVYSDAAVGMIISNVPTDERPIKFVEEVRYTMPYGLDLSFSRRSKIKQMFAYMGLGAA